MAGYKQTDIDLDTLFLARVNTKRADVGYNIGDSDISNLYEDIGTGTKRADVGFKVGGIDISNYFRDINDPLEAVDWTTVDHTITTSGVGTANQCGIRFLTDGNTERTSLAGAWIGHTYDWGSPAGSVNGANFKVRYQNLTGDTPDTVIGTSGVWYPLSSIRTMLFFGGGGGGRLCSFDLAIRKGDEVATEVECRVTLDQQVEP